jgi:hypothetical protein
MMAACKDQVTNYRKNDCWVRSIDLRTYFGQCFVKCDTEMRQSAVSLCMALLYEWHRAAKQNPFSVSRYKLMQLAHLKSKVTYHKCIGQLRDFGYIQYAPSYHPRLGSQIVLCF